MTPDQAALLRKAYASLHAAKLLAGEQLFDFSVSRAYYTMFYVAEALLLGHGLSFSKHSAVLAGFGERLAKQGLAPPEFHRYLLDGEDSRHVGDYDLGPGLTAGEAAEQMRRAQKFLDRRATHWPATIRLGRNTPRTYRERVTDSAGSDGPWPRPPAPPHNLCLTRYASPLLNTDPHSCHRAYIRRGG